MELSTKDTNFEALVEQESQKIKKLIDTISLKIVGQQNIVQRLVIALIADGHILLEGLPGLAKTTSVKTLAETTNLHVNRIQFTPDLLPGDLIGTRVYDLKTSEFKIKKGPIFANLIIADEINRAPAKVQSALLEAMQERQVTIGDETFKLDNPFLVMATQNPIEHEGTYPLPEAQVDRFLFKVNVSYCSKEEEIQIIQRASQINQIRLPVVMTKEDISRLRQVSSQIHLSDKIRKYIVDIVFCSRFPKDSRIKDLHRLISYGISPRGSIYLEQTAKILALIRGRTFVLPQDIKDIGLDVLRHRIIPTYEAEAENISTDAIIKMIFDKVDVP